MVDPQGRTAKLQKTMLFPSIKAAELYEGILMRRYAEGEPVDDVLGSLAPTVENFYKRFFGHTTAPVITAERKQYLDRCLDAQRTLGPDTKGSSLYIYGGNERRE